MERFAVAVVLGVALAAAGASAAEMAERPRRGRETASRDIMVSSRKIGICLLLVCRVIDGWVDGRVGCNLVLAVVVVFFFGL